MTDLQELNRVIDGTGIKKQKIAETLGISKQTLTNKLNGRSPFQVAEIRPLCELLGIDAALRDTVFLS